MPILDVSNFPQFAAINLLADGGHIKGKVQIPSAAQIVLRWSNNAGKPARNVLYGRYTGTFDPATAQARANQIFTALSSSPSWTAMASHISVFSSFQGVDIRDVNVVEQPLFSSNVAAVSGGGSGVSLPAEVAIAVTLRTAKAGRGNRGRMFLPGSWLATSNVAGDLIDTALQTAINNWIGTIFTAFAGQGFTWALGQVHRQAYTSPGGTPHDDRPAAAPNITTATVRDLHWDTIRRRGLK